MSNIIQFQANEQCPLISRDILSHARRQIYYPHPCWLALWTCAWKLSKYFLSKHLSNGHRVSQTQNTFSTGFTCSKETYRVHTSVQRSGQSTTKAYSVLPSFIMWLHRVLQVLKCAELSTAHVYMLRNQCSYLYNLDPSCPVFSLFVSQRFDLFHKSPCRYTLINCSHADISWAMV